VSLVGGRLVEALDQLEQGADLSLLDVGDRCLLLVEDHRAVELDRGVFSALEILVVFARDILPEWFPLFVLAPDILALEKRDFEAKFPVEDGHRA